MTQVAMFLNIYFTSTEEQRHLKMQYLNYLDTLPLAISKHMLLRTGT